MLRRRVNLSFVDMEVAMGGRSWGTILLAIWLICTGAIAVLGLSFQGMAIILGIAAIAAGILILAGR
jgi:hypothetical protein